MKYWLLTTEYPPFFGGGIGTYCANTALMMAKEGHEVSVFINDASVGNIRIENETGFPRIIRFNPSRLRATAYLGHVTNISYEFAHVVKYFVEKEGKPDVIEAQEYLGIAYYLLQFKYQLYDWCRDIPVIITMHSPSFLYMEYNHVPEHKYPNFWICEMERFCLQAADLLISPSRFMLRELEKRFQLRNPNVVVIPNPFENKKAITEHDTYGSHNGEIVFYGKLTVQKGAFYLLKYFQEIWNDGFSRPLYLIGGQDIVYHPEKRTMGDIIRVKYKDYIRRGLLKLENKIKPEQIAARLSRAEVVIIPSANDNLPYVLFEMMSLGKIVLASKQGGQSEVIEDGTDGFIFDHEQPGTFYDQLKKILNLTVDERKLIARKAVEKVRVFCSHGLIYEKKHGEISKLLSLKKDSRVFPLIRENINQLSTQPGGTGIKGLLSVVVPYYNMGKYISETVQSLLESEYRPLEIIIVNDGSNDKQSIEALEQFRNRENIIVVDGPNRGLAHARNKGAEIAKGEFLAFLDADDKVHKSYYSKAIRVFANYDNVHMAGCWTAYFDQSEKIWPAFSPEPPIILNHNTLNSSALVYKRAAFLDKGKNDPNMTFQGLEDYESLVSLLASGYNGIVIPEILFHYRIRSDSMIRSISETKKLLLHQYIMNRHKEFYATFATDLFGMLNANGPGILLDNPSLDYHLAEKIPFAGTISKRLIYLVKKNRFTRKMAYKIYRLLNR